MKSHDRDPTYKLQVTEGEKTTEDERCIRQSMEEFFLSSEKTGVSYLEGDSQLIERGLEKHLYLGIAWEKSSSSTYKVGILQNTTLKSAQTKKQRYLPKPHY